MIGSATEYQGRRIEIFEVSKADNATHNHEKIGVAGIQEEGSELFMTNENVAANETYMIQRARLDSLYQATPILVLYDIIAIGMYEDTISSD